MLRLTILSFLLCLNDPLAGLHDLPRSHALITLLIYSLHPHVHDVPRNLLHPVFVQP